MAVPLRTRSDLKAAGRAMATEAVDAIAAYFATLRPSEMEDEARIDAATARMIDAATSVGQTYLEAGIPADWVRAFLNAFHRTATARLAHHSLAALVATGFATALSHGTSAASAFGNSLSRIGDKLIGSALDSIIGSAFRGGGGGLISGLGSLLGFAEGGYTSHGSKYQPAGIVHAGEYVMPAHVVRQYGTGFFDGISGLRGFADGGFVPLPSNPAPLTSVPAANDSGGKSGDVSHYYDFTGSNLTRADAEHIAARVATAVPVRNNAEQNRTQFENRELARKGFG